MRILCEHGYFTFEEQRAGEIADLIRLFGFDIVPKDGHYTFSFLEDAPNYSLKGAQYMGALATKTFEGYPWQVMRENNLIYDFVKDAMVPLLSVVETANLSQAGVYYVSSGLVLPGSLTSDGKRVTDYSAWFIFDAMKFKYSEVTFE